MGGIKLRRSLSIIIVGILVLSGLGAVALNSDAKQSNSNNLGDKMFTHAVFAEFGSTSSCPHCPYAHIALKNIYYGGWYPFLYTSLALNHNTHANARWNEYNGYGVPDTFFDGGYKVDYGAYDNVQQMMSWYNTTINQCGNRVVPDIETTLNVNWLGSATMDIQVSVENKDTTQYNGRIRVYVTEIESTMGWKDAQNHPYTFAFLDYAFNEVISIDGSDTWTDSITWDGHNYNDGYGHTFGNIQYGNIMVIAAVFNSQGHSAYSDPPDNQHPFTAYYVDDAAGFWVGENTPPNTPSNPNPANGATGVDLNKDLSWTGGDPDPTHDTVTYDVYFGTSSPPPLVSPGHSTTTYDPGTMSAGTTYYWQIIAKDNHGASTTGPIWHFTTAGGNQAPSAPTITGPAKGKPGIKYDYTLNAVDPEGDNVYYFVDWGDTTNSGWIGPYASGVNVIVNHTWSAKGSYTIQAKAKDTHGAEGPWGSLQISMPRLSVFTNTLFMKFLERFPHAFPLLRQILGL